mgnify:CR=1 FL=1
MSALTLRALEMIRNDLVAKITHDKAALDAVWTEPKTPSPAAETAA